MKLLGKYDLDKQCIEVMLAEIDLLDQVNGHREAEDMRWRHIDECLAGFAADTFAEIPRGDRMPLTMAVFDVIRATAAERCLNVSLLVRVGSDKSGVPSIARSNEDLIRQFSQTPRWLTMPPELVIHGGKLVVASPGDELRNVAEIWGRPTDTGAVKCFHRTHFDEEDADVGFRDYLFVFGG